MNARINRNVSIFTKIKVLFGGARVQIGSLFFWMIASVILVYIGNYGLGLNTGQGEWVSTQGLYLGIEETNVTVNEEYIYEYYFSYSVDGQSYQDISYDYYKEFKNEAVVDVEYRANQPEIARIKGMDESPTGHGLIWIFGLVALIPLGILLWGLRSNQKYLYLLQKGAIAQGTYLRSTPTNTSINEQVVYCYEFSFEVNGRTYTATCKTHLYDRVEDEETETILYDPNDPTYNIVSDAVSKIKPSRRAGVGRRGQAGINQAGIGAFVYALLPVGGALIALFIWVS